MGLPRYHTMEDYNPKEVLAYLHNLGHLQVGGCTEIRILPEEVRLRIKNKLEYVGRVVSDYYTDYEKAVQDIADYDGKASVYTTLNPCDPKLVRRSENKLVPQAKQTTSDDEIIKISWLPLDFDPERPSGTSSSEEELQAAISKREEVIEEVFSPLKAEVIRGMSGNGAHGLIKLPDYDNTLEIKGNVEKIIKYLAETYSDDQVKVDGTVFNPSRIWKLYGLKSTKGDPEATGVPQRRAEIDLPPEIIPFDVMAHLDQIIPQLDQSGHQENVNTSFQYDLDYDLDIEAYLSANGVEFRPSKETTVKGEPARTWRITCPFDNNHQYDAQVIKWRSGKLGFSCPHDSCQKNKGWQAFKAKVDVIRPYDNVQTAPIVVKPKKENNNREQVQQASEAKTLAQLMEMKFDPIKWAVPNLIPEGLAMLAGRPKSGKSMMALGLALAVSNGGRAFSSSDYRCEMGSVFFAALEDSPRRLQSRTAQLMESVGGNAGSLFRWLVDLPRLDQGGLEYIERWADEVFNPRLFVIDLLSKVKSPIKSGSSIYDEEYKIMEGLQKLAINKQIAVLLIHHTRKNPALGNLMDEISGSTAITGACDTLMLLKRNGTKGTLYCQGRDIDEVELVLEGDLNSRTWTLLGDAQQLERSDERQRILDLLAESKDPMSPTEIASLLETPGNNIRQLLHSMYNKEQDPLIIKVGRGKYTLTEEADNNNHNHNINNNDNKITNDSQNLLSSPNSDNNQNNKNITVEPSDSKGPQQLVIDVTNVMGGDRKGLEDALSQLRGTNWAQTDWLERIEQAVENGMPCSDAAEAIHLITSGSQYKAGKRLVPYQG